MIVYGLRIRPDQVHPSDLFEDIFFQYLPINICRNVIRIDSGMQLNSSLTRNSTTCS